MKKKMPKGRPFKKGKTGNPNGSSKKQRESTAEINEMQRAGRCDLVMAGQTILSSTVDHLYALAGDTSSHRSLTVALAKLMLKSIVDGDYKSLSVILDYCVGRPKEMQSIELTGRDGGPLQSASTVANMTMEQLQQELAAIRARRKAAEK